MSNGSYIETAAPTWGPKTSKFKLGNILQIFNYVLLNEPMWIYKKIDTRNWTTCRDCCPMS